MNISGVLVHGRPDRLDQIKKSILALPGVEIPLSHDDGRLVVIIDEPGDVPTGEALMKIHDIDGVLSASLVYQHIEEDRPDSAITTCETANSLAIEERNDADHTS